MVFEQEINLYDPNAIANEFHTQSTQISAVQGKISAMISDSQIQELQDGTVNMFDRLVSAEMDLTGIHTQVSSLNQKDGELESQISTISQTASDISLEVSSVKNNYAKKSQIILAINSITQESQAQINAERISLAGKTINLTSDNITINSTYFKVDKYGNVKATSGEFSGKITASSGTIGGFTIGSTSIYNGMTSFTDTNHNGVYLGTNGIALGKGAFKVTSAGALTATNVTVLGGSINGPTIVVGGNNNTSGYLRINNASGTQIGKWDKDGIDVKTGSISGNLITAGKISSANGLVYFDLTNNELACSKVVGTGVVIDISRYTYNSAYYGYQSIRKNNGSATSGICIEPRDTNGGGWITSPGRLVIHCGSVTAHDSYTNVSFLDLGPNEVRFGAHSSGYCSMNTNNLFYVVGAAQITGDLTVTGTKHRLVATEDYGERLLYCYETTSPLFGDVGEGQIAEDGKCYVWIDSIFAETVSLNQYQVFLQKYGDGDCWVSEKTSIYFVVEGTPNMKFGWEIKAKQSDFDQFRLEKEVGNYSKRNNMNYAESLISHIEEIQKEREVAA